MRSIVSSGAFVALLAASAIAQPPQNQKIAGAPPAGGAAAAAPASNALFDALDTDGDGVITTKELRKAVASLKQLDADHDGNITREEASGGGAAGADPTKEVDRIMKEYDKDGDGKLSPREVSQKEAATLKDSDTNHDGFIDRTELTAAMERMRNQPAMGPAGLAQGNGGPNNFGAGGNGDQSIRQLMRGDRNGDGKLTPDEVEPRMRDMLREADTNRDGAIDGQELQAFVQMMHDRMNGRGPVGQEPNRPGRNNNVPMPSNSR